MEFTETYYDYEPLYIGNATLSRPGAVSETHPVVALQGMTGHTGQVSRPIGWCTTNEFLLLGDTSLQDWKRVPAQMQLGNGPMMLVRFLESWWCRDINCATLAGATFSYVDKSLGTPVDLQNRISGKPVDAIRLIAYDDVLRSTAYRSTVLNRLQAVCGPVKQEPPMDVSRLTGSPLVTLDLEEGW